MAEALLMWTPTASLGDNDGDPVVQWISGFVTLAFQTASLGSKPPVMVYSRYDPFPLQSRMIHTFGFAPIFRVVDSPCSMGGEPDR